MIRRRRTPQDVTTFVMALTALASTCLTADKGAKNPPPASPAVATIGDGTVTAQELDEAIAAQLADMRNQEYALRRRALDSIITKKLLDQAAAARQITTEELLKVEVESKVQPITEEETKTAYEAQKARFRNLPEEQALKRVGDGLRQQRIAARRQEFMKDLRMAAKVRIMLDQPRVVVDPGDDPYKGPANAPVTLVEFSEFQCPACAQMAPVLKELREKYGDKIRFVFRDFPLPQHREAAKAAEAASCANDQGKFWEMHDKLFENQKSLQVADLKQHAASLGLDAEIFAQCLDSDKYTAEWKQDMEDGKKYGVPGTPTMYVNGRFVMLMPGASPLDTLSELVDDELDRATARSDPKSGKRPDDASKSSKKTQSNPKGGA